MRNLAIWMISIIIFDDYKFYGEKVLLHEGKGGPNIQRKMELYQRNEALYYPLLSSEQNNYEFTF